MRALVLLIFNLLGLAWSFMRKIIRKLASPFIKPQRRYVKIQLPSGLDLAGAPKKLGPIPIGPPPRGSYWNFEATLKKIRKDPSIEGVIFKAPMGGAGGLAETAVIADRIAELRASGKRVICHLDQATLKDYLLTTSADTVSMTPPGRLYTFGLRMDMMFLSDALSKVGIEAEFVNLGQYKTAMHRFTRRRMTRPQYHMMRQLLIDLGDTILDRVGTARQLNREQSMLLLDKAPMSARVARNLGFVDQLAYVDEVRDRIRNEGDPSAPFKVITESEYIRQSSGEFEWKPLKDKRPTIAILNLAGTIMMGNEGMASRGRQTLTPPGVIKALRKLAKDPKIAAVVLHIDSPGGSALASDLMWRHIRALAEKKPVIASLGNVAASGGYYIAAAAHDIVAMPETVTGSIGVIAGKLSGGPLLEKLGIHVESLDMGETAGFTSLTRPLSKTEKDNFHEDIRAFYRRFLHRVSIGRQIPLRKLHRLARGRVYSGKRALQYGLVDRLGNLQDAIDLACRRASVEREHARLVFVDHRDLKIPDWFGKREKPDPDPLLETRNEPGDLRDHLVDALVPQELQQHLAVALLLRSQSALALWPWMNAPTPAQVNPPTLPSP